MAVVLLPALAVSMGLLATAATQWTWAQAEAKVLCRSLNGLAEDAVVRVTPTPGLLLSAAFLVARDKVYDFSREVSRLEEASGRLRFLLTGPWPAYSFVGSTSE